MRAVLSVVMTDAAGDASDNACHTTYVLKAAPQTDGRSIRHGEYRVTNAIMIVAF
jgi:hypothetical protein